ncbi:MAG: hypothetical protein QMD04_12610 [Anaerolineales bacterium]|nr:hypothetical protein [Anaerolineales bacterium]
MPITYTNRKGFKYFLNKGVTKTGKPRYTFAREQKGEPIDEVPQGYEIEESVNGIVSLVKVRPKLIPYEESACVEDALERHPKSRNYRAAVKDKQIIVYEAVGGDMGSLLDIFDFADNRPGFRKHMQDFEDRHAQYTPVMRFILNDTETREYHAERWCYRGSVDDWIYAGHSGKIEQLARELVPTLGTDDFYELY